MPKTIYASDVHFKDNDQQLPKNINQVMVNGDVFHTSNESIERLEKIKKDKANQQLIKSTIENISN